jgi:hypothetical protein
MGNSIRVIGPRSSGKTTYLAALAYWSVLRGEKSYFRIEPVNDDTKRLATLAENIICEGESLQPTIANVTNVYDLPVYQFEIEVKLPWRQAEKIDLVARDYPGEIFDDLESGNISPIYEEFMEDCLMQDVEGCLVLLSDWCEGSDQHYRRVFQHFLSWVEKSERQNNLRLAIVMSKAERGELWPGRIEPEIDLFDLHLPKTKDLLMGKLPSKNLAFFAISTFGVLHQNDPRPNRRDEIGFDGRKSLLREPKRWQPYGMLAPLYWLNTGRRIQSNA